MHVMTTQEWLEFVGHGTRTGKLAVTRADGSPHVTPIWFMIDGDHIVFTTGANTVKANALRRDPRFALCVDDQRPPYSYVLLEAEAQLFQKPDDLITWTTRLGGRYMGADRAEEFGQRNAVIDELLVRGRITRVTAQAEIAD